MPTAEDVARWDAFAKSLLDPGQKIQTAKELAGTSTKARGSRKKIIRPVTAVLHKPSPEEIRQLAKERLGTTTGVTKATTMASNPKSVSKNEEDRVTKPSAASTSKRSINQAASASTSRTDVGKQQDTGRQNKEGQTPHKVRILANRRVAAPISKSPASAPKGPTPQKDPKAVTTSIYVHSEGHRKRGGKRLRRRDRKQRQQNLPPA